MKVRLFERPAKQIVASGVGAQIGYGAAHVSSSGSPALDKFIADKIAEMEKRQ
jgi:hypothetical protein